MCLTIIFWIETYFICISIIIAYHACFVYGQYNGCDYFQYVEPGTDVQISSPNYTNFYKPNTNCRWAAHTQEEYFLDLECNDVHLPSSDNCNADNIQVSSRGLINMMFAAGRYCGIGSFKTQSSGQRIIITLNVPRSSKGGRFLCKLSSKQNNNLKCECGKRTQSKIVGGTETGINEFPEVAGVVDRETTVVFCGSTIISKNYALTAAHCVVNRQLDTLALLVGDHDINAGSDTIYAAVYTLAATKIHYLFQNSTNENDIALLKTTNEIIFNDGVSPICLPFKFAIPPPAVLFNGDVVEAVGWGTLEYGGPISPKLMKVSLNVTDNEECSKLYSNIIPDNQICTYSVNKDTCQYDSGGALFYTSPENKLLYQIGIVSFGVACAASQPSISTRVTSYLQWILDNTSNTMYCNK